MQKDTKKNCPDCGVEPGEYHGDYCDVERCSNCGGQALSCDCGDHVIDYLPWEGTFPGIKECRELGLWTKMTRNGWTTCPKSDPDAQADLNTLYTDYVWNKTNKKFTKKE